MPRSTSWPPSIEPPWTSRCAARSTCWRRSPGGRSPSWSTARIGSGRPPISSARGRPWRRSPRCRPPTRPIASTATRPVCARCPAYMDAWAGVAREAIETGVTSPRLVTERAIGQMERLLSLAPEESPAIAPVAGDDAAKERIAGVVRDVMNPAFARYEETLREYLPHCTETIGLSALPNGDGIYAALVLTWTTLPLDPRDGPRAGARAVREHPGRTRRDRRAPRIRERRRGARGAPGERCERRRHPGRPARARARAGRAELERRPRVLRPDAA